LIFTDSAINMIDKSSLGTSLVAAAERKSFLRTILDEKLTRTSDDYELVDLPVKSGGTF
jgi:hypothetical protein